MSGRRGVTLIECLVSLVIGAVLSAAVYALLLAGSRLARGASSAHEIRSGVRATAAVLRAELQALSVGAGDLLGMSDSAVAIRAARGFGVTCAPASGGNVVLDDSLLSLLRAVDPTKDSVLVFAAGDPRTTADDRWILAAVGAVRRGGCSSGASGTLLALSAPAALLAGVAGGAPLRLFEVLEYRRYRDASGLWWLGVRGPAAGGGWNASSPVSGPLRPGNGLMLRFLDSAGSVTVSPDSVALVEATVRGVAPRAVTPGAPAADSLVARIALRGP